MQAAEQRAQVVANGRGAWSIWLSPDATVPELAALMGGLQRAGIRVGAEHMGGGAFAILPLQPNDPPPLAELVRDCLEHPPTTLPSLVSKL